MDVRADPEFEFNWHYHPEIELTLIVDSVGQRLVGNGIDDYGAGDLVLLGPNLPHSWRSTGGPAVHRAVVVQFHRNFLGDSFLQLHEMTPVYARLLDRSARGLAFGHTAIGRQAAAQFAEMPSLSPPDRLITLLSVLRLLSTDNDAKTLSLGSVQPNYRMKYQQRLNAVCAYLEAHASEEIDYPAATRLAHMDQASLCRFFRRATGRTMGTYVNELRVAEAATPFMVRNRPERD